MAQPPKLCLLIFVGAFLAAAMVLLASFGLQNCLCVDRRLSTEASTPLTNNGGVAAAVAEAVLHLAAPPVPLALPPCPRVFIYDLQPPFQDVNSSEVADQETVFGRREDDRWALYTTHMFSLGLIWLHRLKKSQSCSTRNPDEADLFFIPFLARGKGIDVWDLGCQRTQSQKRALLRSLTHLNEATAARHFFVVSTGFWVLSKCTGWWAHPDAPFTRVARLTNNVGITQSQLARFPMLQRQGGWKHMHEMDERAFPRVYTVPYPSSVHIKRKRKAALPWASHSQRDVLASFAGTTTHGDRPVRALVGALCHKGLPQLRCENRARRDMMARLKLRSVFCLEPMGDSIGRKSLSDDYGCGCIPVFFGAAQAFQYPQLWSGWAHSAYVPIDRLKFIDGSLDLIKTLERLNSSSRAREMQANIARYGGRFQYHLEDVPQTEDVLSVMLRHLWADAEALAR